MILINGNCVEYLLTSKNKIKADLIIADPPFGINFNGLQKNYNRDTDKIIGDYEDIPESDYFEFTDSWIRSIVKSETLNQNGNIAVFSGPTNLIHALNAIDKNDFHATDHVIWKYNFGVWNTSKFIISHYHILICSAKNQKNRKFYYESKYPKNMRESGSNLNYKDREDVWVIPKDYKKGQKRCPTQLPEKLIEKIIGYLTIPGDTVLDMFMGSGVTGEVSIKKRREFIGIEINKERFEFARDKLINLTNYFNK